MPKPRLPDAKVSVTIRLTPKTKKGLDAVVKRLKLATRTRAIENAVDAYLQRHRK